MAGIDNVIRERSRQVREKGYDLAHDLAHDDNELVRAAMVYAGAALCQLAGKEMPTAEEVATMWPEGWDFNPHVIPKRNLAKAAALIAAEIDRLEAMGQ